MKIFWKVTYKFEGRLKYIYFRRSLDAFTFAKIMGTKAICCVKEK